MALPLGFIHSWTICNVVDIFKIMSLDFSDDLKMLKVQRVRSCNSGMLLLLLLTLCFEFSKHYSGKIGKITKKKDI